MFRVIIEMERMGNMICPHCGKNTRSKEFCDHCKQATEFVSRSSIVPGKIPGMETTAPRREEMLDMPITRKNNSKIGSAVAIAFLAILAFVAALIVSFHLFIMKPQTYQIILDRNLPQEDIQEKLTVLALGDCIPVLPDEEEYIFQGWNTDPAGNGTSFHPGDPFEIPLSENIILYGQWRPSAMLPTEEGISALEKESLPWGNDSFHIPEYDETMEITEPVETVSQTDRTGQTENQESCES